MPSVATKKVAENVLEAKPTRFAGTAWLSLSAHEALDKGIASL